MVLNAASQIIEDAVQQQEQQHQTEHHHEDELESNGHMDDVFHTDEDEHTKTTMTTGTNTHIPPNASSQTDDLQSICSTHSIRTPPNKSELVIDDSQLCLMEQQHQQQQQNQQQQQQTLPRKLKYMNYGQSQQQPQRLATPFPSPSPSQHLELATNGNPNLSFSAGDDDLFAFGQSIASQLRTVVDPYARSVAKLRIQQVLFEAETGQSSEAVSTTHLHSF